MLKTLALLPLIALTFSQLTLAQQVTVNSPVQGVNSSFHEYYGIGLNFRHRWANGMMFFDSGNSMSASPFFGGFDPGSAATFGFNGGDANTSWGLNFVAAQGSSRSNVTTTPTLTLPNGGFGFLNNSTQRPFVAGFTPVVGQSLQQQRIARERLYSQAAAKYLLDRIERERLEEMKLEEARQQSKQRLASRTAKKDDAPLVLGARKPSYARDGSVR